MAVRRSRLEPVNSHDRWIISYADFITLLFAFFVVMYSVSSVNDGKYKVLSRALESTFHMPNKPLTPLSIENQDVNFLNGSTRLLELPLPGDYNADREYLNGIMGLKKVPADDGLNQGDAIHESPKNRINKYVTVDHEKADQDLMNLGARISEQFKDLVQLGQLRVVTHDLWIEVDIKSKILFQTGDAVPNVVSVRLLKDFAKLLVDRLNPVHVEGFTDNVPIQNDRFPSNWELSTARAAAVVRVLIEGGVAPERLAAVGYGEFQPVADNETESGRSQNRRVVLVISKNLNVRRMLNGLGAGAADAAPTNVESAINRVSPDESPIVPSAVGVSASDKSPETAADTSEKDTETPETYTENALAPGVTSDGKITAEDSESDR